MLLLKWEIHSAKAGSVEVVVSDWKMPARTVVLVLANPIPTSNVELGSADSKVLVGLGSAECLGEECAVSHGILRF